MKTKQMLGRIGMLLTVFAITGCSTHDGESNRKRGGAGFPNGEKTFQTLIDKALFLKRPHGDYVPFPDDELHVVKVTTLAASGTGSFSWAVNVKGPKVIVFEVGGVIDLDGMTVNIREPYTYVAGQTAPQPGITCIKGGISVKAHDVVLEHIAVRAGDRGLSQNSGWEIDSGNTIAAYNVLIDHCAFIWGTDENLSASGPQHDGPDNTSHCVTFSNNIIAECLYSSTHPKGAHSMGTLAHDYCLNIAVVGNLFAHNTWRNPGMKPNAEVYVANNVIYNPRDAIHAYWPESEYANFPERMKRAKATILNNVMVCGEQTYMDRSFISGRMSAYCDGNTVRGGGYNLISDEVEQLVEKPVNALRHTLIASPQVFDATLLNVGPRPRFRDDIDTRIVTSVREITGRRINSQNDVGGYPVRTSVNRTLEVPEREIEKWLVSLAQGLLN